MRVIAGKARRLNLKTIPGNETRPTTDRIKETLFNILQPEIQGCQALRSLEGEEAFDCIFMDAPYEQHLEQPVLEYLADSTLADENTLIVVEEDLHTDFSYVEDLGYHLVRSKEYKTNKHVFLKK